MKKKYLAASSQSPSVDLHFLGTYARIILSECNPLANIIRAHSQANKISVFEKDTAIKENVALSSKTPSSISAEVSKLSKEKTSDLEVKSAQNEEDMNQHFMENENNKWADELEQDNWEDDQENHTSINAYTLSNDQDHSIEKETKTDEENDFEKQLAADFEENWQIDFGDSIFNKDIEEDELEWEQDIEPEYHPSNPPSKFNSIDTDSQQPEYNLPDLNIHSTSSTRGNTPFLKQKLLPILTTKQIQAVLSGPYAPFITMMMNAYAKLAHLRFEKHAYKENIFKEERAPIEENIRIAASLIEKISFSILNEIQQKLDTLIIQFDQDWRKFYHSWALNLAEWLTNHQIHVTSYEIEELCYEEPIYDIFSRFTELNLNMPKHHGTVSFMHYLSLRLHLVLQSALSRQHLPHADTDIHNMIKKYKSEFNSMAKEEKQLLKQQQQQVQSILKAII